MTNITRHIFVYFLYHLMNRIFFIKTINCGFNNANPMFMYLTEFINLKAFITRNQSGKPLSINVNRVNLLF